MSSDPGKPAGPAGRLITFEGVEGSGKSTQLGLLAERLESGGARLLRTREPGGTELGRSLRRLLLTEGGPPIAPSAELLLYAADRAQHLEQTIRPALRDGLVVLCDRYVDATIAYQGHARGLGVETVRELHRLPVLDLRPDRTILLDLAPGTALERARARNDRQGLADAEGRFESETLEFHRRVREGYLALAGAEPDRIRVVAADGSAAEVHARVVGALADLLPELGKEG